MATYNAEFLLSSPEAPVIPDVFYMRAYSTTLARLVYWTATAIDPTGAQYGGGGALSDVVWLRETV